ncbi:hypothetical protein IJ135_02025 [Candidatus Saccharibacteria bacterium]|nr:hypothetical protein [Candidatus Saccharibacteria bacterium]
MKNSPNSINFNTNDSAEPSDAGVEFTNSFGETVKAKYNERGKKVVEAYREETIDAEPESVDPEMVKYYLDNPDKFGQLLGNDPDDVKERTEWFMGKSDAERASIAKHEVEEYYKRQALNTDSAKDSMGHFQRAASAAARAHDILSGATAVNNQDNLSKIVAPVDSAPQPANPDVVTQAIKAANQASQANINTINAAIVDNANNAAAAPASVDVTPEASRAVEPTPAAETTPEPDFAVESIEAYSDEEPELKIESVEAYSEEEPAPVTEPAPAAEAAPVAEAEPAPVETAETKNSLSGLNPEQQAEMTNLMSRLTEISVRQGAAMKKYYEFFEKAAAMRNSGKDKGTEWKTTVQQMQEAYDDWRSGEAESKKARRALGEYLANLGTTMVAEAGPAADAEPITATPEDAIGASGTGATMNAASGDVVVSDGDYNFSFNTNDRNKNINIPFTESQPDATNFTESTPLEKIEKTLRADRYEYDDKEDGVRRAKREIGKLVYEEPSSPLEKIERDKKLNEYKARIKEYTARMEILAVKIAANEKEQARLVAEANAKSTVDPQPDQALAA